MPSLSTRGDGHSRKVVVEHKARNEDRQYILCTIGATPTEVRPSIDSGVPRFRSLRLGSLTGLGD